MPAQYVADGPGSVTIRGRVSDPDGAYNDYTVTVAIEAVGPTIALDAEGTTVGAWVGESFFLDGAFVDPGNDAWLAEVDWDYDVANPSFQPLTLLDRTFRLEHTYASVGTRTVAVRVTDTQDGLSDLATFTVQVESNLPAVSLADVHLFYNRSVWDGYDPAANELDDAAIDPAIVELLPGQTASSVNVSSSAQGINGVMVDLAGLDGWAVSASDFLVRFTTDGTSWQAGPAPIVSVRAGAGTGGSDRGTLTWPDGTLRNGWVEITANTSLGFVEPYSFRFGSLPGDSNGDGAVDDRDLSVLLSHWSDTGVGPADGDTMRDGVVDDRDLSIVLSNWGEVLPSLPSAPPAEATASSEPVLAAGPTPWVEPVQAVSAPEAGETTDADPSGQSWAGLEVELAAADGEADLLALPSTPTTPALAQLATLTSEALEALTAVHETREPTSADGAADLVDILIALSPL